MLPQLSGLWRQQRFSNVHRIAYERFWLWAKRDIDAALGSKHIRHHRMACPFHAFEQQRRTAFVNHAAMDFGELEVRIDLGFDGDDLVFPGESIEECAQARMHSAATVYPWASRPCADARASRRRQVRQDVFRSRRGRSR